MGSLTVAPAWLLDLAAKGERERKVADKLVRAVSVIYRRTGHVLDLESAPIRNAIAHSAGYGAITNHGARCLNCNTIAALTKWTDLALASREYHFILAKSAAVQFRPHDYLYMQRCPGAEIAAMLAESPNAPSDRRG